MKYLLDTHFLIWLLYDYEKINKKCLEIIENNKNEIYISKVSFWEISIKFGLGRLELNNSKPDEIESILLSSGYKVLDLKSDELLSLHNLPQNTHKDPFDRMLVWQAIKNNLTLLSKDSKLELYKPFGLKIEF